MPCFINSSSPERYRTILCLVHLETIKLPVGIREIPAHLRRKLRACRGAAVHVRIELRGPRHLAADVDIGHNALVLEVRRDIAVRARKIAGGLAPFRGIRATRVRGDVGRDFVAREHPHADSSVAELHRVDLLLSELPRKESEIDLLLRHSC